MEKIMVDTSAIYALMDMADSLHLDAKDRFISIYNQNSTIIITNFVVAESHALISSRLGHDLARAWLKGLCWPVERVTEDDEGKAYEILFKYTDKSFSYTDATSFAVMERLGLTKVLGFDQHFIQYGFELYGHVLKN